MNFDIKRAFTYMSEDSDFRTKLFTGTFLVMLTNFVNAFYVRHLWNDTGANFLFKQHTVVIFSFVVFLILTAYLLGYYINCIKTRIESNSQNLPSLGAAKNNFADGIKIYFCSFIFAIPALFADALMASFSKQMFALSVPSPKIIFASAIFFYSVSIIVWFLMFSLSTLQDVVYTRDCKVISFFDLKSGFSMLVKGFKSFFLLVLTGFIVMAVYLVTMMNVKAGGSYAYLLTLLLSAPVFYALLVYADLLAQWAVEVKK